MTLDQIAKAISRLRPGAGWRADATCESVDDGAFTWIGPGEKPSQIEVENAYAAIVAGPTADELGAEVIAALNGGAHRNLDPYKLLKAKFISDLAHRLGKAPGALTGAELAAERNRIAAIYKAL